MTRVPNRFGTARPPEGQRVDMNFRAVEDALVAGVATAATNAAAIATVASDLSDFETAYNIVQNCMYVGSNSAMSTPTATNTNVSWTTTAYDPYNWHTSGHLVTPNVAGFYTATLMVRHPATGGVVTRQIGNIFAGAGATLVGTTDLDGIGGYPRFTVTAPDFYLDGSTYVYAQIWQNSGATKDMNCTFSVRLVNPA